MSRLALGVLMQLPQGSIFIASSPSHENSNTYTKVSLPSASFHYNKSPLILTSTVFCFQFLSLHLPSGSLSSQLQVRVGTAVAHPKACQTPYEGAAGACWRAWKDSKKISCIAVTHQRDSFRNKYHCQSQWHCLSTAGKHWQHLVQKLVDICIMI